jgi:phosphoglycerate dehydrogenase-like enzyme
MHARSREGPAQCTSQHCFSTPDSGSALADRFEFVNLLEAPNAILTPHIGGVAHESTARLREVAIRNLTSLSDGGPVVNEIVF